MFHPWRGGHHPPNLPRPIHNINIRKQLGTCFMLLLRTEIVFKWFQVFRLFGFRAFLKISEDGPSFGVIRKSLAVAQVWKSYKWQHESNKTWCIMTCQCSSSSRDLAKLSCPITQLCLKTHENGELKVEKLSLSGLRAPHETAKIGAPGTRPFSLSEW